MPDRKAITPVSFAPPPAEPAPGSHKSTADIILAPTPPPKAPSPQPFKHVEAPKKTEPAPPVVAEVLPPQEPVQSLAPASPVPKVESISRPQPQVPLSSISPVLATVDTKVRPVPKPAPKHSEVLKYIQDEERSAKLNCVDYNLVFLSFHLALFEAIVGPDGFQFFILVYTFIAAT